MNELSAYHSTLNFGLPALQWPPPGSIADADDESLQELRRRCVDPVLTGLFTPEELAEATLRRCEVNGNTEVWVHVTAGGEDFDDWFSSSDWPADQLTAHALAARLADHLEDWVCETRFGWGQQRTATYVLPDPEADVLAGLLGCE